MVCRQGLAYYGAWFRGRRHGKGVERLVMRGVHVEAFTVFDMGEVDPQPSTLNPQPSTLNPQPSTLNPEPWTLNLEPWTLDPES